ncbi:type II secretion system protein [Synechococcus sp. PCC 7336]|uniref:type II secretion system protein n=1 Tax=Synechococcus sp. PCC 7336 TaxID=195250 RepID=UPI000347A82D|nr:type II secretion system protein [Synechococcus sp. PCC 7336]
MFSKAKFNQLYLQSQRARRGSSLVEVMVATVILLLALTGVSNGFMVFSLQNRKSELSGDAVASARQVLDRLRLATVENLPNGGDRQICNPDNNYVCVDFNANLQQQGSVIVTYCPNVNPSYCSASEPKTRHILIDVLDNNGNGGLDVVFSTETVFSDLRDL